MGSKRSRKRQREPAVYLLNDWYTGESDAHQAVEHIVLAVEALVKVITTSQPASEQRQSLQHLRQAHRWLATAKIADLDQTTRWITRIRLGAYLELLEPWQTPPVETSLFAARMHAASGEVTSLWLVIYQERSDHIERLYAERHISRWTRWRLLRRATYDDPPLTRADLMALVRRLHRAVARIPVAPDTERSWTFST